jgi:hypothetical protein
VPHIGFLSSSSYLSSLGVVLVPQFYLFEFCSRFLNLFLVVTAALDIQELNKQMLSSSRMK